jgi:hypothetical protein
MSTIEKNTVQIKIAEIINRSRCGSELFFTDSKTAASDILKYLQRENIIPTDPASN